MSKKLTTLGSLAFASSLLCGSQLAHAEGTEGGGKALNCVQSSSEARFEAYAYNHLVTLHNECDKAATCTVTTDLNPDPILVDLSPAESKTVVTFRASPSRVFHAQVSCKERS